MFKNMRKHIELMGGLYWALLFIFMLGTLLYSLALVLLWFPDLLSFLLISIVLGGIGFVCFEAVYTYNELYGKKGDK